MSKIEDLIPPLELCQQIPEGEFADSALVWGADQFFQTVRVLPRGCQCVKLDAVICPAPTLAEIMDALYEQMDFVGAKLKDGVCQVGCFRDDDDEAKVCLHATNPATAALKLWLEARK